MSDLSVDEAARRTDSLALSPIDALRRLASWDEMAGNGDPAEFPTMYRQEIAARINLALATLDAARPASTDA